MESANKSAIETLQHANTHANSSATASQSAVLVRDPARLAAATHVAVSYVTNPVRHALSKCVLLAALMLSVLCPALLHATGSLARSGARWP